MDKFLEWIGTIPGMLICGGVLLLLIAIIILIFTSVRGKKGKKDGQVDAANVTPIADATVTPVMDASVPVVAADPMAASAVAPMNVTPVVDPMATVTPVVDANQVMAAAPVAEPMGAPVVDPMLVPATTTAMPVVDSEERMVGIITIDDIVDVLQEENTEDFEKMAAINPTGNKTYLKKGFGNI